MPLEHHVADAAVERRGLAHDVDAAHLADALTEAREEVVRGHAERVVDVDEDRVALREALDAGHREARIEELGIELAEVRDLRVDVDVARAPRGARGPCVASKRAHLVHLRRAGVGVDVRAQQVVEERRELRRIVQRGDARDLVAEALGVAGRAHATISSACARA